MKYFAGRAADAGMPREWAEDLISGKCALERVKDRTLILSRKLLLCH